MENKQQPTQPKRTLWTWWNLKAVKIIVIGTLLIYGIAIVVFYWISVFDNFSFIGLDKSQWEIFLSNITPPVLELISVFVGLVLGFYWDRADKIRRDNFDRHRITGYLISELEVNEKNLQYLYTSAGRDYTSFTFQTTVYDIYEESIGSLYVLWVPDLISIYHRLFMLNNFISKYPFANDIIPEERQKIRTESTYTKGLINSWINDAREWYQNPRLGKPPF